MESADKELARQLKQFGVEVGPITNSTRDLYRRILQKRLKAAGKASGKVNKAPPKQTAPTPRNRSNARTPNKNMSYHNSPADKSNTPLNSPSSRLVAHSSRLGQGGGANKRPAPIEYQAEPKRPRLDVYNPSSDEMSAQEDDMEMAAAAPIAFSSPKYQKLYPTLPDNVDNENTGRHKPQVNKRLSLIGRSKQQAPPIKIPTPIKTPPPNRIPNQSNVSLSPPSPSVDSDMQDSGGFMSVVTGFIGAGVKKLVHQIASPRRPIRGNKMAHRNRKSSDLSASSSSGAGVSSIPISEVDTLDVSLPHTPPYEPEPREEELKAATGYDWELLPSDVKICKKADGTLWRLGKGGFGEVFKGLKDSVDEVAVKVIRIESTPVVINQFKQEIDIISKLRHRHILQFYGACIQPNCLYMVTELMQTDLFSSLRKDIRYMWTGIYGKEVLLGVAAGLHYLHCRRPPIVHRDIKSPNVLLMDGIAKIADVGIARTKADSDMTAQKGYTMAWASPEVVYRKRATEKIDIWSFGVMIWEVVSGKLPRVGHLVLPSEAPPLLGTLYAACVDENPNKRPSAAQVITQLKAIK